MHSHLFSSRQFLNHRHRLSHQQIDELLNEQYSKKHLKEKYQQLFQAREFIEITDKFRDAHISFIPLKGPLLSEKLHKDASYRYSNDLDFLIEPASVKKAISLLKENGYNPPYFSWPSSKLKEKLLLRLSNQILFTHQEKNIHVEIHWKLFKPELIKASLLRSIIKSNTIQLKMNDRKFQVLDNELELLYLIIHGGLHSWFRLKWLLDVKNYIENKSINHEKFIHLTNKFNALRMVFLCNSVLAKYFPESPSLPCNNFSSSKKRFDFSVQQIENENYYDKSFYERLRTYWYELNCFRGLRFKLSMIGIVFYGKYLKMFEFHLNSQQD